VRPLDHALKARIKADIIAACNNPTGYPDKRDAESGCQYDFRYRAEPGLPFMVPDENFGPRECACLLLFSVVQRHADFNFRDYRLFRLGLEGAEFAPGSKEVLDRYLADPEAAWHGKGLFIWGKQIGCGKTTVAHQVVRRLYEWAWRAKRIGGDYRAWYMLASDFADRAWRGRDGFKETMHWGDEYGDEEMDLWDVPGPFVLDEFGRDDHDERKLKASRTLLESFLRHRQVLPTIIVSHLPPPAVKDAVSEQAISLLSTFAVVEVAGGDRRCLEGSPFYG